MRCPRGSGYITGYNKYLLQNTTNIIQPYLTLPVYRKIPQITAKYHKHNPTLPSCLPQNTTKCRKHNPTLPYLTGVLQNTTKYRKVPQSTANLSTTKYRKHNPTLPYLQNTAKYHKILQTTANCKRLQTTANY